MNKHVHSSLDKMSAAGLLVAIGIVFGDIGTSPLYTYRAIIEERTVTETLALGGASAIFWTLTFQTTLKYVLITLRADNNGEGGIFSLYVLIRRYAKWLLFPAIAGGSFLIADSIITPPISVSSAIEGLLPLYPNLTTVPILLAILFALFVVQQAGTDILGKAFGPIMAVWFSMIGILGAVQVIQNPGVIRALNPYYAYDMIHVELMDDPYTTEYSIDILEPEEVVRITFRLGFRVQPRINLLFRKVVEEMVRCGEVTLNPKYRPLKTQANSIGDFRFIVIN